MSARESTSVHSKKTIHDNVPFPFLSRLDPIIYKLTPITGVLLFRPFLSQSFISRLSINLVSACFGVCCRFPKKSVLTKWYELFFCFLRLDLVCIRSLEVLWEHSLFQHRGSEAIEMWNVIWVWTAGLWTLSINEERDPHGLCCVCLIKLST